jgi:Family of unknown function (DUF5684)
MSLLIQVTQTVLLIPTRLLAQVEYSYSASSQGQVPGPLFWIFWLAFMILIIAGCWKVFTKAGQPGWASIIPIYNVYIWCKIVGRPGWWVILLLIPFVNFIIGIILSIDLAKSFGKGVGFGLGLAFLGFIFWPILGFGSAQYQGPAAGPVTPRTAPQAA